MLEVFCRGFGSCSSRHSVEMPTNGFTVLLDLNGEIAIQGTLIKPVVALGPIAIQGEFLNMDNEHVSRHCSLYVKRAGLRIAAERPFDPIHISPARIHRSRVNCVSWIDSEDRFVEGGYLTIEDRRRELMSLGPGMFQCRRQNSSEFESQRVRLIIGAGFCIRSVHLAVCERSGDFIRIALFIRGNEMQGSPVESADILVAPACGRHFITGLFKVEERSQRSAEIVCRKNPTTCVRRCLSDSGEKRQTQQHGYTGVGPSGTVRTKPQVISDFTSGDLRFQSITTHDVRVRVYGNAAVETGLSTMNGQDKGNAVPHDTRFTRVWVKQHGGWRLVANHYSSNVSRQ